MKFLSRGVLAATALALVAAVMTTAAQDAGNAETVAQPDPITFPRTLTSGKNSATNEQCGYF